MKRNAIGYAVSLVWTATAALTGGCDGEPVDMPATTDSYVYMSEERQAKGLVIILPGIEGESEANHNVRRGLLSAGVDRAVPIHLWGSPIPGVGMFLNQVNVVGNRVAGSKVANLIVRYKTTHPDQPVHIIGHSGGGGVAVFAAEALPDDVQIDGLVLLSASISAPYDLSKALTKCKSGVVNFFNRGDVGLLVIGTTLMGNVDGVRGPGAGAGGFTRQFSNLHQVEVTPAMTAGDPDAHFSTTRPGFASRHISKWVLSPTWPPPQPTETAP